MKIRTDFVTNSSSSSFTLLISIELKEGGLIDFTGVSDCEGEYEYYQLTALKSPKQLCACKNVDELVEMLKNSVVNNGVYGEGFPEDGFSGSRCYGRALSDESDFICEIKERIGSMDDIQQIFIQGQEEGWGGDYWYRTFTFDNETKEYTLCEDGCEFEGEGRGGFIEFTDEDEAAEN